MKHSAYFLILLTFCISLSSNSQVVIGTDSLQIMFYNLTNYGNTVTGCTSTNNGLAIKNPEFKTIMQYVKPDILGVCEMNTNPSIAGSFMNNVMNTDGITHYQRSAFQTEPSGTLTSILIFNSLKLGLKEQSFAPSPVRLVHHFRLYLKTGGLENGDTIWLNVLVCHLKAGNTASDRSDRNLMATAVRNYLNNFPKRENCLIMGDFNLYNNSEAAWQTLTAANPNPIYQFIDPVNRVGSWTLNPSFADVHTQCPSVVSNGCFSGGGLDDRFDFILMNRHLLFDSAGLKYKTGSYKALGNDGQHFNKNITDNPPNLSAPTPVLVSMYKASDHLPVLVKLEVAGLFTSSPKKLTQEFSILGNWDGQRLLLQNLPNEKEIDFSLFDSHGRNIWLQAGNSENGTMEIPTGQLKPGIYYGSGQISDGRFFRIRFINLP